MTATPGGAARDVKEAGVAAAAVAGTGGAILEDMAVTAGARTTTVRVSVSGTGIATTTAMSAGAATGNASVAAVATEIADAVTAMTAGTVTGTAGATATATGRMTRRAVAQREAGGRTTIHHLPGLMTGRQPELRCVSAPWLIHICCYIVQLA